MVGITKKAHILSILKYTFSNSKLTEVIHPSLVSTNRTHLSIYSCTLDDAIECVTNNQTNT